MAAARQEQFRFLLSGEERATLDALAEADGLSASDVLRRFIRKAGAARRDEIEALAAKRQGDRRGQR